MEVREAADSGRAETDALVVGPAWISNQLTFSFPTSAGEFSGYAGGEPSVNFEPFDPTQQAAVRKILSQIASFTNLTFTEQAGGAGVLRFGMSDEAESAHAYLPHPDERGGDSWFNNSSGDYDDPVLGNYAWFGLMHEIGHALGLGHPHEAEPRMPYESDRMPFTVMSYSSYGGPEGYFNEEWGFAQSFMMEDIAALQFLYGANYTVNAGDTVYSWNQQTGELSINGVGQGTPGGNRVFMTVWDGGGSDTYDFSNYTPDPTQFVSGVIVDLGPGRWTSLPAGQTADIGSYDMPNIANALLFNNDPRSLIENAVGSSGHDQINGHDGINNLFGGAGDDRLEGFGGDDVLWGEDGNDNIDGGDGDNRLFGGHGADTLLSGSGDDWLDGGPGSDWLNGGPGHDTLISGEGDSMLVGHEGDDLLIGNLGMDVMEGWSGNDTLLGSDGDDILRGGPGDDVMTGGLGNDTYELFDLGDQMIEFDGEGIDTVLTLSSYTAPSMIENVTIATGGDFTLTGNSHDNILIAAYGGKSIIDGGPGADIMRGGEGDDTYYVDNPNDVVIDNGKADQFGNYFGVDTVYSSASYTLLSSPVSSGDPYAGASLRRDDVYSVEILILTGSGNIDGTGSEVGNTIYGNPGNNVLNGKEGNDVIVGGAGADTLDGGADFDIVDYRASPAALTLSLAENNVSGGDATGDIIINFEGVYGTAFDDFLTGSLVENLFHGGRGADTLIGGDGIDTASYALDEGAVFVNLTLGRGYANASFGDTYDSIENVVGTDYNDFLIGDPGVNSLDGAGGDDTIIGAVGPDAIIGGAGLDWASYEDNSGVVFVNLTLRQGFNNAAHGDSYDGIENLIGGLMDDFFIGDEAANRLLGAMGADTLVGAGGGDVFAFTYAPGADSEWGNPNVDTILDMTSGDDTIELAAVAFAGLAAGALPASAFVLGTAAAEADDRILYEQASGNLWFDADGSGGGAAVLFAVLDSKPAITAADFAVV